MHARDQQTTISAERLVHPQLTMFLVYLLKSPTSSYIGFTVNLERRLRQHNREIKGGAKKTKNKGRWEVAAYVKGFRSRIEALQFEWMLQHPHRSVIIRDLRAKNHRSAKKRLELMYKVMEHEKVMEKWGSQLRLVLY